MRRLVVLAMTLCLATTAFAQGTTVVVVPNIDLEQIKTVLTETRRQVFDAGMQIDTANKDAFWNIYTEYEKEKQVLDDKRLTLMQDYAAKVNQLTSEQALTLANGAADVAKKEVELRQKYTNKIAKKVNGTVGARFYQIDAYITTAMTLDILDNMELIGAHR